MNQGINPNPNPNFSSKHKIHFIHETKTLTFFALFCSTRGLEVLSAARLRHLDVTLFLSGLNRK